MFHFTRSYFLISGTARHVVAGGLLSLSLLAACSHSPTPAEEYAALAPPKDGELHFDERYLDSISAGPPYSERTKREMAIDKQLSRLSMNRPLIERYGYQVDTTGDYKLVDSVYEGGGSLVVLRSDGTVQDSMNAGPPKGFRNRTALLADIYRKIDSLKVLEGLPITPHFCQ